MSIEGELVVRVAWDGYLVRDARIESSRPLAASSVLEGIAPDEAAARVPRLFSICRRAWLALMRSPPRAQASNDECRRRMSLSKRYRNISGVC